MRHLWKPALLTLIILIVLVGCTSQAVDPSPPTIIPDAPTPSPLPTIALGPAPERAFTLLDGTETTLEQWRGKGIILNFWATWCYPCRTEMPLLAEIHESQADVVVIGVNYLENQESADGFVRNFEIPFPIVVDQRGFLASDFAVKGLPTTIYINADGQIVGSKIGPITEELAQIIPTLVDN